MKTLVLGLGNPILTDDSVGFRVIQELRARFSRPSLTLMESSASGLTLLDLIAGYDKVIFVDAIQTEGGQAGTIYRLGTEDLGDTRHLASSHGIDLVTVLELGKRLEIALPQEIIIFAIEVADVNTFSEGCTPEVEKAIPLAVGMVAEELGGN